jgi:hypothetical protein
MRRRISTAPLRVLILAAIGTTEIACSLQPSSADAETTGRRTTPDYRAVTLLEIAAEQKQIPGRRCLYPEHVYINNEDTGFVRCRGDWYHRAEAKTPFAHPPRLGKGCDLGGGCTEDRECGDAPYGFCNYNGSVMGGPSCGCSYGCSSDADCKAGKICAPGFLSIPSSTMPQCIRATCRSDDDCGRGLCAAVPPMDIFSETYFACQTPDDECDSHTHCGHALCQYDPPDPRSNFSGRRRCLVQSMREGRPFLVHDVERTADAIERDDWAAAGLHVGAASDDIPRGPLAEHWTRVALMEHASVAAFSRFALQLLSLGAPPALLEATQHATADEIRHAKVAFTLASRYAERPIGPSALDVRSALESDDPVDVVRLAFLEGCVGECVAAMTLYEGAGHARQPDLRALLTSIADDESRHAELAWRFVTWACAHIGGAVAAIREECARLEEALAVETETETETVEQDADDGLREYGVIGASLRQHVHRAVLSEIVLPCATALLRAEHRVTSGTQQRSLDRTTEG